MAQSQQTVTTPSVPCQPSIKRPTNSASSTSTTSVTYLRNAAAAFIATAHQNHFQFPHKVLHPDIQPLSAQLDPHQQNFEENGIDDDAAEQEDNDSFTSHELRTLPSEIRAKVITGGGGVHNDAGQDVFMTDNDDGMLRDERDQGFESTTPPLDLGQVINNTGEDHFWRQPHQYDPILFPSTTNDAVDVDAIATSDAPLFPLFSYRPSLYPSQWNHIRPSWSRSRSTEKEADQAATHAGEDANEFTENPDRQSWVSELSSGEIHLAKQQQQPHDHPMSFFSPAIDANGSGQAALQESRSEQDREVFEVCSRRLQRGYTPSQNIHKALVSSIRSSFLASLSGSQRASLMNSDSSGINQQSSPDEGGGASDLEDFQQPWYQPQHLPYHASPDQDYAASRSFEKEDEYRRREEELLEIIAQSEKDLQELHNSTLELQASLRESEERNERLNIEHSCALQRVKEEHDHQIRDTKKRTKRFYDETMRKRQRDEDKRLQGLQEQLSQAQTTNKDLRTTIRGLQRERLDVEQGQRDDLAVLCLFIENVLGPLVFSLTAGRDGDAGTGTGTGTSMGLEKVVSPQGVGPFKRRQPSTITIPAITTISAPQDIDLTPTAAVPHPLKLSVLTTQDKPLELPTTTSVVASTTTTTAPTGQQQLQQCVTPRGQKCMSLLEQFQSALSISYSKALLTDAVTTKTATSAMPVLQQGSPEIPVPSKKTHYHSRHNSAINTPAATNITKRQYGRYATMSDDNNSGNDKGNDKVVAEVAQVDTHLRERIDYINSRLARKRYSDSSTASSGHTVVAASAPPLHLISIRQGVSKNVVAPTGTTTSTTPRSPSVASEKPADFTTTSSPTSVPNTTAMTMTAISSPLNCTPPATTTPTNTFTPLIKTTNNNSAENDKSSFQQCLAEQHTRYQKEIERIKQQCIKIYRQSLEDVRADVKFKLGQRRQRASSTTAVPVTVAPGTRVGTMKMTRVATAAAH
ncbi:hypothetical protein EC991_009490 [Linnemannia zychae]|nr:hypothetical protein EC991_009490 [Linnemannia zychae]